LPAAAGYRILVSRHYSPPFPPLLMQRRHFSGIIVNLLQNAREVLQDHGEISVTARRLPDHSIELIIADNGPGIPPDKLERIFEAYYSTRDKGTGLGLAIVKHNTELYAGTVRVESELGKGARFILVFPAKAVNKLPELA
jgi:signal transduction histidine kinase